MVIHPEEAEVVREMARRLVAGQDIREIAGWLKWPHVTVRAVLSDRRYVGEWVWGKYQWVKQPGKQGRRKVARPKKDWVAKQLPELALFDDVTWATVQRRLKRTRSVNFQELAKICGCKVCERVPQLGVR